jgi:hypothetical protein
VEGERRFFFWTWLVTCPVFSTGFSALLLKHAGIDGETLIWNLQVNSSAISVKLMWIKAEKPVDKTGKVTSQAQK